MTSGADIPVTPEEDAYFAELAASHFPLSGIYKMPSGWCGGCEFCLNFSVPPDFCAKCETDWPCSYATVVEPAQGA